MYAYIYIYIFICICICIYIQQTAKTKNFKQEKLLLLVGALHATVLERDSGTDICFTVNFAQFLLKSHIAENFHAKGCFCCFPQVSNFFLLRVQNNED